MEFQCGLSLEFLRVVINFFITLSQPLHPKNFSIELMMRRPVRTSNIRERRPILVGYISTRRHVLVSHISKRRPVFIAVSKRRVVLIVVSKRRPVLITEFKRRPVLIAISKEKTKGEDNVPVDQKVNLPKEHVVSMIVNVAEHVPSVEGLDSRMSLS